MKNYVKVSFICVVLEIRKRNYNQYFENWPVVWKTFSKQKVPLTIGTKFLEYFFI